MDGFHLLQSLLDELLAQQLREHIENDAIADAEEEMERSWNDVIRIDGEERSVSAIDGMFITWLAVTRGFSEAVEGDDADGTRVCGRRRHKTKDTINEWPIAIDKGSQRVDKMLAIHSNNTVLLSTLLSLTDPVCSPVSSLLVPEPELVGIQEARC